MRLRYQLGATSFLSKKLSRCKNATAQSIFCLFYLFIGVIEELTDENDNHRYNGEEQNGESELALCCGSLIFHNAVGIHCAAQQHQAADNGQGRHKDPLCQRQALILIHFQEHRNVHTVQRHDYQFAGICIEQTKPTASQICAVEVKQPECSQRCAHKCGVHRHLACFVNGGKELRLRTIATGSQRVQAAGIGDHNAVGGTQAGDRDKHRQQCAEHTAKQFLKGKGCATVFCGEAARLYRQYLYRAYSAEYRQPLLKGAAALRASYLNVLRKPSAISCFVLYILALIISWF